MKIRVLREYRNRNDERRTLDPGFISTMAVLTSQRTYDELQPEDRDRWFVFHTDKGRVFRELRPTRYLPHDEGPVCVADRDFMRVLGIRANDRVSFRPLRRWDLLYLPAWLRSMTPATRIAFWLTMIGVVASAGLGTVLGTAVTCVW